MTMMMAMTIKELFDIIMARIFSSNSIRQESNNKLLALESNYFDDQVTFSLTVSFSRFIFSSDLCSLSTRHSIFSYYYYRTLEGKNSPYRPF